MIFTLKFHTNITKAGTKLQIMLKKYNISTRKT